MCEFQRCGKSLLWNFSSAISAVSLSSLGVRQGKAQAWSISFFFSFIFLFYPSSSSLSNLPPCRATLYASNCDYTLSGFTETVYKDVIDICCLILDMIRFSVCSKKLRGFWAWSKYIIRCDNNQSWLKFFFYELILCKNLFSFLPRQKNMHAIYILVFSGEADLDAVCEACLPYLSCRQPIRLQEASLRWAFIQACSRV